MDFTGEGGYLQNLGERRGCRGVCRKVINTGKNLEMLVEYEVKQMQIVDMFSDTQYVETVALPCRK